MLAFLDSIPLATPRLRRVGFWLCIAFAAYVLGGFLLVPAVLKSIIASQGKAALGRTTHIEAVSFNPLTLALELRGFSVDKREGDGPFIAFSSLSVSPGLSSTWRLAPVISALHVRDFLIDVTFFGEGRYSISDLIGASGGHESEKDDNTGQNPFFPFALYGFEMDNATIIFDDRPHDKRHIISELNIMVPFTSSFKDLRQEFTQPRCSAVINGDPVELTGRSLPFHDSLLTEFQLGARDVDLDQYWSYLPVESSLRLVKGRFSSTISLYFERPESTRLKLFLGGGGTLTDLELDAPGDGSVLVVKELGFHLERFSLGDQRLIIRDVTALAPSVKLVRRADGDINWARYFPGTRADVQGADVKTKGEDNTFRVDIHGVKISSGSLDWTDQAVPGGFRRSYSDFSLTASKLTTGEGEPGTFSASIGNQGVVSVSGQCALSPLSITAEVKASGFALAAYKPYLDLAVPMSVDSGTMDAGATIEATMRDDVLDLAVHQGGLTVSDLLLRGHNADKPNIELKKLTIAGTDVNLGSRTVRVTSIEADGPLLRLERTPAGTIDLVDILAAGPQEPTPTLAEASGNATRGTDEAAPDDAAPADAMTTDLPGTASPPWAATIDSLRVGDGSFVFTDRTLVKPATLGLNEVGLTARNIATGPDETMICQANATWAGKGTIRLTASASLTPLKGTGTLTTKDLGLAPINPYLAQSTELRLGRGAISTDLTFSFEEDDSLHYAVNGGTTLNDLQLLLIGDSEELAVMDALTLSKINLASPPLRLGMEAILLQKPLVFLRFDEKGGSNIRTALRLPQPDPTKDTAPITDPTAQVSSETEQPEPATPAEPAEPSFFDSLKIGVVAIQDGALHVHDASFTPPYVADITGVKLFLNHIAQTAEARPKVELRAHFGNAPMSASGVINPVSTPFYSDLDVTLSGLELSPLSPYTNQYLGYPVERGRLYAKSRFKAENMVLTADNKLFIEQLNLGPKDTRPGTPNIPVKFGLTLLQDSKGDMELDLPIRGRLDDPDFRIGGLVFKTMAGLFVKALASPFSLLGSIFGGGANMEFVVFDPGRKTLDAGAKGKLETIVTALKERPRLKLEVTGVTDPETDKKGLAGAIFEGKLKQQKYDALPRSERQGIEPGQLTIELSEYDELLYQAYRDEPDEDGERPRGLFNVDRQSPKVMHRFIMDRITVTDEDMRKLAVDRAKAVEQFVLSQDPALAGRVFLSEKHTKRNAKPGVPQTRADLGIR
jgi:uncharacterized protein involved in outer membrane biogenesis